MSRYDYLGPDSSLLTALDHRNADELKLLLSLLPGAPKVGRKGEIIEALARCLLSDVVRQVWAQLKPLAFGTFDSLRWARSFLPRRSTTNRRRK